VLRGENAKLRKGLETFSTLYERLDKMHQVAWSEKQLALTMFVVHRLRKYL
jgi:hypothetical protein